MGSLFSTRRDELMVNAVLWFLLPQRQWEPSGVGSESLAQMKEVFEASPPEVGAGRVVVRS